MLGPAVSPHGDGEATKDDGGGAPKDGEERGAKDEQMRGSQRVRCSTRQSKDEDHKVAAHPDSHLGRSDEGRTKGGWRVVGEPAKGEEASLDRQR